ARAGAHARRRTARRLRAGAGRARVQRADHLALRPGGTGRAAGRRRAQFPQETDRPADVRMPGHRFPRRGWRGGAVRAGQRRAAGDTPAMTIESRNGFTEPAKKHLGQNFLHDTGVIDRIVQAIDPQPGDAIVEIGPGQGALTFPLLKKHGYVTAIEFDRDLHAPLQAAARAHGRLHLIEGDVLGVDFTALAAQRGDARGPIRLAGNLPYNLSTTILFHALDHAAAIRDMHFMLQKEVVERMAAGPGSKVYGRLSVMLQAYCAVTPLFVVPPGAFRPAPKVDSAVVRLVPKPQ